MHDNNMKSKKVKFYLKNKKNGWGSIVAIFNFGYIEDGHYRFYQYRPGEEIPIDSWDTKEQRLKKGSIPDWDRINRKLNTVENEIIDKYEEMVRDRIEITPESFRTYKKNDNENKSKGKTTLLGFAKNYKKTCGKNYKTTRHYGTTINVLEEYSRSKRIKLNFNDIDLSFYNNFIKFLSLCINHLQNRYVSRYKEKKLEFWILSTN